MEAVHMPRSAVRLDHSLAGLKSDVVPLTQRRSLSSKQHYRTAKQPAVTRNNTLFAGADQLLERTIDALDEEEEPSLSTTDALVGAYEPITKPPLRANVTPLRPEYPRSHVQQPEPHSIAWLKIIGLLVVIALVLWGIIWAVLSLISFGTDVSNTYHYGPTRTSVVSGVFGMNNDSPASPTSVIAINIKGTLVIESLPAGDVSKAKVYPTALTLLGDHAAKLPVILTIKDLNGDHKPDVLISIPGQGVTLKLINSGTEFTLTS